MQQQTRYVQGPSEITLLLGSITKQECQKIQSLNMVKTGRPYLVLLYAKMKKGSYITYQEVTQFAPQRFKGDYANQRRSKETLSKLYKNNLIEQNPNNPEQFRITYFGIKYLYAKKYFKKR